MSTNPNREILSDVQWEQAKGKLKEWWDKLTDDDLRRIDSNTQTLIDVVQERYEYTKEQADREVAKFMEQFRAKSPQT